MSRGWADGPGRVLVPIEKHLAASKISRHDENDMREGENCGPPGGVQEASLGGPTERLLEGLPVRDVEHSGRPLRDHLVGTHDLLKQWGNAQHVCLAGLFHSVYGTKTFLTAMLGPEDRERVRAIIGTHAELLVFIFAMSDRKRLLLENRSAPYHWIDHQTGVRAVIPGSVLNDLVELEVANFLEQMPFLTDPREPVLMDMQNRFEAVMSRMSAGARNACRRAFDGWPGSRTTGLGGEIGEVIEPSPWGRPLDSLRPFIVAANVRATLETSRCSIGPGRGEAGDLILGRMEPAEGERIVILDQHRDAHTVTGPQRVLAVLGSRDSSTHVCAVIPTGGLDVEQGLKAHWIAGESGIVGCLERQPVLDSTHDVESAVGFECDGLVLNGHGQPVNIRSFAVEPPDREVSTPIVLVAATSSSAGKTVLSGEVIRRLAETGLKVGAIKASGTGGVLDSLHHQRAGATAVLDFVDAGLITTHVDPRVFRARIPLVFRQMQALGAELIVAELGGDLLSASNPELFRIEEIIDNSKLLLVISNDPLGATGVIALNDARLGFPGAKVRHFSSPFRNHAGVARRMASAGIPECHDPRSPDDLARIVDEILAGLAPADRHEWRRPP